MRTRKQFRVWDKYKKEMIYDGFILRPNNPPTQEYFDEQNELYGYAFYTRPEYTDYESEPEEIPTEDQNDDIKAIMHDETAEYSLIDWSNFYGQENYITMQATGMHDKNGQLIWEYDLLEKDGIVDLVEWYYCNFIWNGQQITDFRDFDKYGKEIIYEPTQINVLDKKQVYTGIMALGYQGDTFGLETKSLIKIGNIFEDGEKFGFDYKNLF